MSSKTKKQTKKDEKPPQERMKFQCVACEAQFDTEDELFMHQEDTHPEVNTDSLENEFDAKIEALKAEKELALAKARQVPARAEPLDWNRKFAGLTAKEIENYKKAHPNDRFE